MYFLQLIVYKLMRIKTRSGSQPGFVQKGILHFFPGGGGLAPLWPENPLNSIDFTHWSKGGGLARIAPPPDYATEQGGALAIKLGRRKFIDFHLYITGFCLVQNICLFMFKYWRPYFLLPFFFNIFVSIPLKLLTIL